MNQTPYKEAKQRTKLDDLKAWMREKALFSTNEVKQWGVDNFFTSSDVRCRELARTGFLTRISDSEARRTGLVKKGNAIVRWYVVS